MKSSLAAVGAALALFACSCAPIDPGAETENDDADSRDSAASATEYVGIGELKDALYESAWYDINHKLTAEFDDVCGDTFCEGDYSNLTSLTFSCAVTSKAGNVSDCVWTFAASQAEVDPATAALAIDAPRYECHVHPGTTAKKLVSLLSASPDAIHEVLPGMNESLYDALGDCFDHPIGQTPIVLSGGTANTYVEASDYYTSSANRAKWAAAKQALVAGFDNVCGDTFCGSDYGDLQSLSFVCSVTKSTGNVKSCAWVFGGSSHWVLSNKKVVQTDTKTWQCPVTVKGSLSQLVTTLTAAGTVDPIRRPLPGTTSTAYDSLLGCLP